VSIELTFFNMHWFTLTLTSFLGTPGAIPAAIKTQEATIKTQEATSSKQQATSNK
jgi:hypothetical protein